MKLARWEVLAVLAFCWLVAGGPRDLAQEPSPELKLELRLVRKPPVVHPAPDPATAEEHVGAAIAEIEARERDERLMREVKPGPLRRPDLSYDVWSGIQARNINNALRRR